MKIRFPKSIKCLFDTYTPRFITEDVALIDVGDHYEPVCSMKDLRPGEQYDAVATWRSFNFFGLGLFPKMIGKTKPWPV